MKTSNTFDPKAMDFYQDRMVRQAAAHAGMTPEAYVAEMNKNAAKRERAQAQALGISVRAYRAMVARGDAT